MFAYRLTAPLRRLADHAMSIRDSGELIPLPEDAATLRSDEIGGLSRSFNHNDHGRIWRRRANA